MAEGCSAIPSSLLNKVLQNREYGKNG